MPVLFGRQCVAPLLIALAQEHPGLELEMSFSDRVVDLVEEGFDMAVRNGTLQDSSVLVARKLGAPHGAVRRAGLSAEERPATKRC
jgi:DNA-binding transcriptional LysR family regulator